MRIDGICVLHPYAFHMHKHVYSLFKYDIPHYLAPGRCVYDTHKRTLLLCGWPPTMFDVMRAKFSLLVFCGIMCIYIYVRTLACACTSCTVLVPVFISPAANWVSAARLCRTMRNMIGTTARHNTKKNATKFTFLPPASALGAN